jgi:putative ABC transport system permease protein
VSARWEKEFKLIRLRFCDAVCDVTRWVSARGQQLAGAALRVVRTIGTLISIGYFATLATCCCARFENLQVVGRVKPGVALKQANADLATVAAHLAEQYPDSNRQLGAFAAPLREEMAGDARLAILVLLGAVGFVLLIACANVANLLLARAAGRQRELSVRMALGAGRGRIVRQMLTESLLLSVCAGAAGVALSIWGLAFSRNLIPASFAPGAGTGLDWAVLIFALLVSVATGLLFGTLPALRLSRLDLTVALKQGGERGSVGSGSARLRSLLVVSEVALALVLLTGGTLMMKSFLKLRGLDPGFRTDHVLSMQTVLPTPKYEQSAARTAFYDQVLARVAALPGVISAGYTTWLPLTNRGGASGITVEGRATEEQRVSGIPNTRSISTDYMRTLSIPLMEGRMLDGRDQANAPLVALVNQTAARDMWPDENPLGRRFKFGAPAESAPWISVAGVVGDVHQMGLDVPARAEIYVPYAQQDFFAPSYLAVKTAGDPLLLANAIREQIWAVDPDQPVAGVMLMQDLLDDELAPHKVQASVLGGFAGMALLLAALGIYAVLSFAVTQRTPEIGVRVALGAQSSDVLRMILGAGARLALAGAAIGLASSFALARILGHLLYGVSASDPATFVAVPLLLAAVALSACYIPARRAMRVDPMVALRYE